jgi:predicted MFS family arabinose efflux permease
MSAPLRPAYARYVLGLLFVVYVMNFVDRQILAILLDPIKRDLGVSDTAMGFLTGFAFAALYTVAGIPIARFADRSSRRTVIAAGLAVWSAMTAASGLARSFGQLALARVGVGIGEAAGVPPSHSLIADYFPPERRAAALGFYANGIYVGTMLAFLLGGSLATRFDWRTAFLLVGLPGLPLALLVWATVRELPRGASEAAPADTAELPLGETLRFLFARPTFVWIALGGSLLSLTGYGMLVWGPAFLGRVHGMEPDAIGRWLGILIGVAGSGGAWLGGLLADRLGRREVRWTLRAPAIAMLAGLPFGAGFLLLPTPGLALLCFAPFYALSNMHVGPVWSALQGIARLRMRATVSAVFGFILNLIGLGLGPLVVGMLNDALAERYGAGAIRWSLCAVAGVGAIGALFLFAASRSLPGDLAARDVQLGAPARARSSAVGV